MHAGNPPGVSKSTTPMSKTTSGRLRQRRNRRLVDYDKESCRRLRVILLGDSKVGKTSLLRRFVKGTFDENADRTFHIEEMEKKV